MGRSGRGPVRGAGLDPLADRAYPFSQFGLGIPAEVTPGAFHRERAALQLTWPGRRQCGRHGLADNLADDAGQLKHADLGAGADVPGARPAGVGRGEERGDGVSDIDIVAGLGAVTEYRRANAS